MSTYYTTWPQTVSFTELSEAFQASRYWDPSFSVDVEVVSINSKSLTELRFDFTQQDSEFNWEFTSIIEDILEDLQVGPTKINPLRDFIRETYLTPNQWTTFNFGRLSPALCPTETILNNSLYVVTPSWVDEMKEEGSFSDSSDNYFTGLGSALFAFYVNAGIEGEAFVKQNEKSKQLILSLQSAWFDRNIRRTAITELIQEELKIIANVVSTELRALVLELLPFNLDFVIPSTDIYNAKASIHLLINNPTRADSLAEILSNLITESGTEILQTLQMRTGYEIPLSIDFSGYNPMNLTDQPNIRIKRNGTTSRYPVKDKRTGCFLWVGGNAEYFSFDRYGGNSPAVSSMEQFLREIYSYHVTVVSEYEGLYQLAGRGAEEFDGFFDYLARYEGIAEGTIEPIAPGADAIYMVDGEFDLDAAISALADRYSYYGDDNTLRHHLETISALETDELGQPILQYTLPLEEVYARVESYDSQIEAEQDVELIETFNTQSGEVSPMESEQSRPFFNPQVVEPYDLSELASGSEVSYGAEWGNHRLDGDGYCEVCDAYGLNCIEQGGNSPESIAAVEEAIRNLENSLQSLKEAGVTDMRELKSAIKQAKLKMYSMMNENRCTCDREYGEADPDCMACLNEWRNQRYGPDIHDVECVCNDCVPMGRYSSYAESYEADGKVRTMSGKPHTPRKLVKDKNITPKDASKRLKLDAESFGADTTFIKWFEESESPYCWTCGKENLQGHFEGVDNICEPCESKWIYDEGGPEGEGYYLVSALNEEQKNHFKMDAENYEVTFKIQDAESGQMCEVCYGNDDLPYDSDHFTKCGRCGKSVCMDCDGEMEYHPDWFKVCGECDTILENVSIHGAESFGAEKEIVVDKTEESGITTETRQRKVKTHSVPKMKETIPSNILNQTDSDDLLVLICGGLLGIGVGLGIGQLRDRFNL